MMQAQPLVESTEFGDMNGPLAYWGPSAVTPTVALSPTERALLLKLRVRLRRTEAAPLTVAVNTLLSAGVA